ncbi:cilia- and flagella-associated protein 141-like isoform X1 [Heptranchias perlo]|uniref:cilia- and flagella-associated protein 141-like isoform X1 n=1 Tax=Heptranchias perlo TaxID=212740 RepID=UPI00355AAED7
MCSRTRANARFNQSHVKENLKREDTIQAIEMELERWRKLLTYNIALKFIDATARRKINDRERKQMDYEVKMARKAFLLIRQSAMKELFETEYQQYLEELHMQGKTFHKERI